MTKLPFASTEESAATIFQKYPIFWWTNYILISILAASGMIYYFTKTNMLNWLDGLCRKYSFVICITAVILWIIMMARFATILKSRCSFHMEKE